MKWTEPMSISLNILDVMNSGFNPGRIQFLLATFVNRYVYTKSIDMQ